MSSTDFSKKRLAMVFTNEGERISFSNDNLVVKSDDGEVKLQTTCYRISALFIIGHVTVTSALIQKSGKFGFPIYLMTPTFRTYDIIGHKTEGHVELRERQYAYEGLDIGKKLIENKIDNQIQVLRSHRTNDWALRDSIDDLRSLKDKVSLQPDVHSIMGIEGNAAKRYFQQQFEFKEWTGRRPRIKTDYINSTLDIGYTILFNVVDSMLSMYGFDTYKGVLHSCFYMRKSLVCDLVEPFRPMIDRQVRKSINLGQCKPEHFNVQNGRYLLSIEHQKDYAKFLSAPLIKNKDSMFRFFQSYYRCFDRSKDISNYPVFRIDGR